MADEVVETAVVKVEADMKSFTKDMTAAQKQADRLGDKVADAFEDAIVRGKSLEDVFSSLAQDLSKSALNAGLEPLRQLLSGSVSSLASGLFSSLTSSSSGGLASFLGGLTPFAKGGVVSTPSLFPTGSSTGLMGEAGAEAIMPLQRGADGRLGVAMPGGGGQAVNIVMNISTPDASSFSKSENQIATRLARVVGRGRRGL
ncbi:phage tail tape measure protein [uncultured Cohaesibacter sp.]|uniref:phage tail tape measure protein n=1 Tax=uncultured Cohaesibacter sp. TaxID=1002546 RepID=UPI0029C76C94|nr:phage tail tape measure protein [uncultured Cohaesibacter sp.]